MKWVSEEPLCAYIVQYSIIIISSRTVIIYYLIKPSLAFIPQLIKSDLDGTIDAIQNKLDERALLRQKKVFS